MDGAGKPARGVLPPRTAPIRFAAFTLDLDGCALSRQEGVEVPLTRNEFALLREFVRHPGRVLSRDYFSTRWPESAPIRMIAASTCWSAACAARSSRTRSSLRSS